MKPCAAWKLFLVYFVGAALLIFGLFTPRIFDNLVRNEISDETPIRLPSKGTLGKKSYRIWKDIPSAIYLSVYFFEVANPTDVVKKNEKPYLVEKGPYVYRERRQKRNVFFSPDQANVSYGDERAYHFVREMSVGDENDRVRVINLPFLTVLNQAQHKNPLMQAVLKAFIDATQTKLFQTRTVKEWLWGYEDPLLLKINQTQPVPLTFFGFLMHSNNTVKANVTISTGVDKLSTESNIISFNGQAQLDFWTGPFCNSINGSDGTFFHPFVTKDDLLYVFSPKICRSIVTVFEKECKVKGIDAYRFVLADEVFQDHIDNPDNECFCTPNDTFCLGAGMLNMSNCQFGAPFISSQPHFLQADPIYASRVGGLHPDPKLHRTVLDVEPNSGMVLRATKGLQFNAYVKNLPAFSEVFGQISDDLVVPILWGRETSELDEVNAKDMRSDLVDKIASLKAVTVVLVVVGGVVLLVAIVLTVHSGVKRYRAGTWTTVGGPAVEGASSTNRRADDEQGGEEKEQGAENEGGGEAA